MLTLSKIAKEIGVSKATVSLVLNGKGKQARISGETVRKVRDYCEHVNYLPNVHARRMCQEVVKNIMVLLNIRNGAAPESSFADCNVNRILGGIAEVADAAEFTFGIRLFRPGMDENGIFNSFRNREIDGMIYYGMSIPEPWLTVFEREERRIVGIGIEPGRIPGVNIDNYRISRKLTERLIDGGRRQFLYLAGATESYPGRERYRGFRDALAAAAIPFDENRACRAGAFQEDLAAEIVPMTLATLRPDAIVCANDKMALGAIAALKRAGIAVPDIIAVAGGDNIEVGGYLTPGLTTFDNRAADMGRTACRMLLDLIAGGSAADVVLDSTLVLRESA